MSAIGDRAARLRSSIPLAQYLAEERGLALRPEGSTIKALCPFHNDKNPSLQIDPPPGTRWFCHACGAGGDIVSWLMRADSLSFVEAIELLSAKLGLQPVTMTAEERTAYEQRVAHHRVLDKVNRAFLAWAMSQAARNLDTFRDYIEGKRGLTLDIARQYQIGYADAGAGVVRAALLAADCSQAEIDESLLLADERMFQKRIVVGVKNHGQMRLIYGRSVVPNAQPAHLYQTGADRHLFNLDRTDKADRVILTESIFDTLALVKLGYEHEAVGALGVKMTEGQIEDLKRVGKKVWILYDNDRPGLEAAIGVGLQLSGASHAITRLLGKVKDPNEFLLAGGTRAELDQLLEASKSDAALTLMITSIDATTPRHELPKQLEPILEALAAIDDEMQARSIVEGALKNHFSLSASELSPYRSRLTKLRQRKVRQVEAEKRMARSENPELPEQDVDLKELHNGVSYVDGDLWYQFLIQKPATVFDPKTHVEKTVKETQVWYVSSSRAFRRRDAMKVEDEIVVDMTPVGIHAGRWAMSMRSENSIERWRRKEEAVSPATTYAEIRSMLKQYLWYPDERYFDVITTWVFMTYWLPIFDTVGYLFLHASPRSGKTTTMEILELLAFEAELMGDISGSALFRKIEGTRGAMLLDEMEKLASDEFAKSGDPINQVLLTGYKAGGNTQRTDLDLKTETNSGAVTFSTFCPKVIANTQGIRIQTIRDRSIELMLLRSDHKLPQFNKRKQERSGIFVKLRNDLYTIALKYASEIVEIYEDRFEMTWDSELEKAGLFGRDYEVWIALWTVGMFLEEQGVPNLMKTLISMAEEHKGSRDSQIAEESIDAPVLKALRRFVREHSGSIAELTFKGEKEWYTKEAILGYLHRYRRLHKVQEGTLMRIMQRLHIISPMLPTTSVNGGPTVAIVNITKQKVMEAIKRYDITDDDLLMEDETLEYLGGSEAGGEALAKQF